ncbi:SRPBCC family protein [Pinibacter aurantiacus]|uniref:SRPBCC family protein n=1 Tax=Pinibacter aurantiacus TaxID=2851599 RepID=A0A9E2S8P8_9BACT|nr:SRPBCC family protein [Pinibacter aurantiacus]MBV4357612.1 SRPBCC family protein [Pinibacter aurantiacus]
MKYKYLLIVFFCVATNASSFAQMQSAQKQTWDFDTTVKFNKPVPALWDAIKDPAKWATISNGYITSIDAKGETQNLKREITFADGSKRKDEVTQYQPEYKFIVLKITDPVPASITENTLAVHAATEGEGVSSLHIFFRAEGDEAQKAILISTLRKEIEHYMEGLQKM